MSYRQLNFLIIATAGKRTGPRLAVFQARCIAWEGAECSPRAAEALTQSEIEGVDHIAGVRRGFFEHVPDCDPATVAKIGHGGRPGNLEMTMVGSAVKVIATAGRVMIDVKMEHDDATGLRQRDHARLSVAYAVRLHDALMARSPPRSTTIPGRRAKGERKQRVVMAAAERTMGLCGHCLMRSKLGPISPRSQRRTRRAA